MSKPQKIRLDQLLVDRGLADSRTKAQALVMAGLVYGVDRRFDKPGVQIAADTEISVKGKDHPWVSRGGMKLAKGLDHFRIDPTGLTCLDLGASTGGFTDVLLAGAPPRSMPSTWGRGSSIGNCARTTAWWCWKKPTPAT